MLLLPKLFHQGLLFYFCRIIFYFWFVRLLELWWLFRFLSFVRVWFYIILIFSRNFIFEDRLTRILDLFLLSLNWFWGFLIELLCLFIKTLFFFIFFIIKFLNAFNCIIQFFLLCFFFYLLFRLANYWLGLLLSVLICFILHLSHKFCVIRTVFPITNIDRKLVPTSKLIWSLCFSTIITYFTFVDLG